MRGFDAPLLRVTTVYVVVALVMTWPLARGFTSDIPGDLGDSLLNLWILGWGAEHLPQVAAGQMSLGDFWNANIFHPEPLALSFSEHLFGQALQILPVYWLTGNLILAYNLLFLSSFVLSGVAMYLLVREWLDDSSRVCWPALVAGLVYAFVPYRIAQVAHLQSISSQWMPLALYGFVRFIRRPDGEWSFRSLGLGVAALLMQNWSCGYYLIYFTPFVVLLVVHQILAAGRWREWRLWAAFAAAGVVVAAGTWPFLTVYLEAQRFHGFVRPLAEVVRFSADVYSYVTAPDALRLWGDLQVYPKPEGALFFGVVPWLLFLVAAVSAAWRLSGPTPVTGPRVRLVARGLRVILLVQVGGFISVLLTGGFITSVAGIPVRATNGPRLLLGCVVIGAVLLAIDAAARARLGRVLRSPSGLAIGLTALAMWLSLGPRPQSMGQPLQGLGLYGVLYDAVPGFEGLRVPARYAMIAAVFVSAAAGLGLSAFLRRVSYPRVVALSVAVAFLIEAAFVPMTVNASWGDGVVQPPPRVEPAARAPAVYRYLAGLRAPAVIAEFPFGDPAWELRYVYYTTVHWKRVVNGYSGGFPRSYLVRAALFARVADQPDAAWRALRDAGTTHVIVHEAALADDGATTEWLHAHGARAVQRFDTDVLYALPIDSP